MNKSFNTTANLHFFGQAGTSFSDNVYFYYCLLLSKLCMTVNKRCMIYFHGYVENPFKLAKKNNSIVVVPSRYESFSMVTVEGLSHGLPVVVPTETGASEIVNNNQIGICFQSGNVSSLGVAIKNAQPLLKNSRENMIKRASDFHIQKQFDRLQQHYQVICEKR